MQQKMNTYTIDNISNNAEVEQEAQLTSGVLYLDLRRDEIIIWEITYSQYCTSEKSDRRDSKT